MTSAGSRRGSTASARVCTRVVIFALMILVVFLSACATVGKDFPSGKVSEIKIGKTTQTEIEAMFGKPWRTGIEDGLVTWTYGKYHYSAFSQAQTKDLVVRFDNNKIVRSYSYNTTAEKK
jgi:hypothetical protein